MDWTDVKKLLKMADKSIKEVTTTTESQLEIAMATTALSAKKFEVIDEYIKEHCDDRKVLKAFDKYTKITLQIIKSTYALIENDIRKD
mgnify:CR=1 FL=1|jgi:hypothetical protein